LSLTVNGQTRQAGRTSRMIFSPAELIAHASSRMTMEEGDLLFTGTPEGVGPLVDGDRVIASIDGLPDLALTIRR
jgi:2-keto-4-pentenoate hydratase/2-oxohepta-3-ene-1,7-dioic acid hydratase in catechol pathway